MRRPPVAPRSLAHSRGSDGRGPHRFGDRPASISAELLTALLRSRSAAFVRVLIIAGSFSASAANKCRMNGSTSGPKLSDHKRHAMPHQAADEVNIADELSSFATATERRCLRASSVLRDAQEPAEGSPSSAGSCVPAIGYPLPGPRCVGRGAGRRALKRRSHGPYRSAVDAVGRQKESSVSVTPHLCSVPNANA